MSDRDDLTDFRGNRIATTEARLEGFYWVILGQNPPEIAYWERGEWWLAGDAKPLVPGGGDCRQRPAGVQAAPGAGGVRLHWLTGWITHPSQWIDIVIFVALVGAVIFVFWAVFG